MAFSARRSRVWLRRAWRKLRPETLRDRVGVSVATHALVLFLLINGWWIGARRFVPAGAKTGTRMMLTYNPRPPAPPQPIRRIPPQHHPLKSKLALPVKPPEEPAVTETATGNQAKGNGDVSILFVHPFPHEPPDLSSAGQSGDVVVDIEIDGDGHVAQAHTRKGMGSGIDEMVVATVEQWVFQPAMRDGKPVHTSQELHFHYDRGRGPGPCGWECFALEDR